MLAASTLWGTIGMALFPFVLAGLGALAWLFLRWVCNTYRKRILQPRTAKRLQKWLAEGGNEVWEHFSWADGDQTALYYGGYHTYWHSEEAIEAFIRKHAVCPVDYHYGDQGDRKYDFIIQPVIKS